MPLSPRDFHHDLASSAINWWRDAGVDTLCADDARNWLAEDTPPVRAKIMQQVAEPEVIEPAAPTVEWPGSIEALKLAIEAGSNLPGMGFSAKIAAPRGEAGAAIMVLGDIPEEVEISAGSLGAGQTGILLNNMLRAIGIAPEQAYLSALAHSRPATGSLDPGQLAELATFAQHHISLVDPKIILLIGSAACQAMLGKEHIQARGCLETINHNGRNRAAVATFHPRTLLARPVLKAQAWRDLQMLAGKDAL